MTCAEALALCLVAGKLLGKLSGSLGFQGLLAWCLSTIQAAPGSGIHRFRIDVSQQLPGLRVPSSMVSIWRSQQSGNLCCALLTAWEQAWGHLAPSRVTGKKR